MNEFDHKLVNEYSKGSPIGNAKSHLKTLDLLDKEIAKYADLHAKLQSAEQKITALNETIDSQQQTNAALVNKLEVAEKEAKMWHNKYNQSADSEDSLFEQAIKATKQREDALNQNVRIINERNKFKLIAEKQSCKIESQLKLIETLTETYTDENGTEWKEKYKNSCVKRVGNIEQVFELQAQVDTLEEILETLVDKYVCNKGTQHQFISCKTLEGTPEYWENAIKALSTTQAEAAKQHELLNKVFIEASKICSDMALGNPVVLMRLNLAVCNYTKYQGEA